MLLSIFFWLFNLNIFVHDSTCFTECITFYWFLNAFQHNILWMHIWLYILRILLLKHVDIWRFCKTCRRRPSHKNRLICIRVQNILHIVFRRFLRFIFSLSMHLCISVCVCVYEIKVHIHIFLHMSIYVCAYT